MNFNEMPNEILMQIFSYFPENEKFNSIGKVCQRWRSVVESTHVFKRFQFFETEKTAEEHEIIRNSERQFATMKVTAQVLDDNSIKSLQSIAENNSVHLKTIEVCFNGERYFNDKNFSEALKPFTRLEALMITDDKTIGCVTAECEESLELELPKLKSLQIKYGKADRGLKNLKAPNLQKFRFKYVMDEGQILDCFKFLNGNSSELIKVFLGDPWIYNYEFYWSPDRFVMHNVICNREILSEVVKFVEPRAAALKNVTINDLKIPSEIYRVVFGENCQVTRIKANLDLNHRALANKSFPTVKQLMLLTFEFSRQNIQQLEALFPNVEYLIIILAVGTSDYFKQLLRFTFGNLRKFEVLY